MDALSGIQFNASPAMGAELLAKTSQQLSPQQSGQGQTQIPTAELGQLGSTLGTTPLPITPGPVSTTPATGQFSNLLGQFVREVNNQQVVAGETVNGLLSGQNVSLHQAMIAMEEASVSFQLMVEVRNKLLESYQELMRMQV